MERIYMERKQKQKRIKWRPEDEEEVIELWKSFASELRSEKRNRHLYAEMARQMSSRFKAHEVYVKIRNLTQKYRAERRRMELLGGIPSQWIHYDAVHQIVDSFPNPKPRNSFQQPISPIPNSNSPTFSDTLLKVSPASYRIEFSDAEAEAESEPEVKPEIAASPAPSSSSRKRKKENFHDSILKQIEQQTRLQETHISLTQELCNNFRIFLRRQEEKHNAFLEVLNKLVDKLK